MAKRGVHLLTWVDEETKQRFTAAAHAQHLSASALLKQLVEQRLAASGEARDDAAPQIRVSRDARLTVRLRRTD